MSWSFVFALAAAAALVPLGLSLPAGGASDGPSPRLGHAAALGLALVMSVLVVAGQQAGGWRTGFAPALWLAHATTLVVFAVVSATDASARRLSAILASYLGLLAVLALFWQQAPGRPLRAAAFPAWLLVHVGVALIAYGLLTVAAVASAAVVLQERALRLKRPTRFSRRLPAIADGERIQTRLLVTVEVLLAFTLVTGAVVNRGEGLGWLSIDHKTVLSISAFALIGALLLLHGRFGLSGRRAARYGLVAWLLVTLAYPGVKLVTDVILARGG